MKYDIWVDGSKYQSGVDLDEAEEIKADFDDMGIPNVEIRDSAARASTPKRTHTTDRPQPGLKSDDYFDKRVPSKATYAVWVDGAVYQSGIDLDEAEEIKADFDDMNIPNVEIRQVNRRG